MTLTAPKIHAHPLTRLPSMLAIRDLRTYVRRAIQRRSPVATLVNLLRVDPLTVLRCLRWTGAPVNLGPGEPHTLSRLVARLGSTLLQKAFETPVLDVTGTGPLRKLWVHSVATGLAAQTLALVRGRGEDNELAYLQGLLHDLPAWFRYLSLRQSGRTPTPDETEGWVQRWNLPREVLDAMRETVDRDPSHHPGSFLDHPMVWHAERLAELAGFPHPEEDDPKRLEDLRAAATPRDTAWARELHTQVRLLFEDLDLPFEFGEPDVEHWSTAEPGGLFPGQVTGNVTELLLALLQCKEAKTYQGVLTVTTAASLRYLDVDRAFVATYQPSSGALWLRAKADFSSRRMHRVRIQLGPVGRDLMGRAMTESTPQILAEGEGEDDTLLTFLGAAEVLVVPVQNAAALPTYLILDRALSGRSLRMPKDHLAAMVLARTSSMLLENLLLRKRRQRAEKFALTDPLTRLYNRSVGLSSLESELARSRRSADPLSVLMLDMDAFKNLNDTYGHLAGDVALRRTADVLRKTVRRSDVVCRYGGEEFLVVLPAASLEEATVVAARIFTEVNETGRRLGLPLSVSIGLAAARTEPSDSVETLLSRADQALYASKVRGRNRFSASVD